MPKLISATEIFGRIPVVGRRLEINSGIQIVQGPISVFFIQGDQLCIRNRWLVKKRLGLKDSEWDPVGHTPGFTRVEGPFEVAEDGTITGKIGDSVASIFPFGKVTDEPYPIPPWCK